MCSVLVAIQTGALPSKVRVADSNPLPGTGKKNFPYFSSTFFPFLILRVYPGVHARLWEESCAFIWRAFLPWTSTVNIPVVVYLAYGGTANFRFRGPIAKINISKERQDYGDRSGPRILEIDPVILKLSRFPQVQSERERTSIDPAGVR